MNDLDKLAGEIASHAMYPPRAAGQPKTVNTLSPHFEKFVYEKVRGLLIRAVQKAEQDVTKELIKLDDLLPETHRHQLSLSAARLNHILHNIYK